MITDGCRVSYIGTHRSDSSGVQYDEQGVVLAIAGKDSAHVKWDSGKVTLTESIDLSPIRNSAGVEADLDDSLDISGLSKWTAETIFNERGPEGLLEALGESGALSAYEDALAEAMDSLIATVANSGWLKRLDIDARADMALMVAKEMIKKYDT